MSALYPAHYGNIYVDQVLSDEKCPQAKYPIQSIKLNIYIGIRFIDYNYNALDKPIEQQQQQNLLIIVFDIVL